MSRFRLPGGAVVDLAKWRSTRARTGKAKGRSFEKSTAEDIRASLNAHPEDVKRTPASIGGKDIVLHHSLLERFPYHVECKNHKTLSIPAWLRQAEEGAATEGKGLKPIVVFKQNGDSKKWVCVDFDHFLQLVQAVHAVAPHFLKILVKESSNE